LGKKWKHGPTLLSKLSILCLPWLHAGQANGVTGCENQPVSSGGLKPGENGTRLSELRIRPFAGTELLETILNQRIRM
jgi:hypothetical protein